MLARILCFLGIHKGVFLDDDYAQCKWCNLLVDRHDRKYVWFRNNLRGNDKDESTI